MLSVADIYERVRAQLAVDLPTWTASQLGWDEFARATGGAEALHQSYVLATPSSAVLAGRQVLSATVPTRVRTTLRVRWLYRLRAGARDEDYAGALEAETLVRNAVLATARNPELRIDLDPAGATRQELDPSTGPLLLGEIPFLVRHAISLA